MKIEFLNHDRTEAYVYRGFWWWRRRARVRQFGDAENCWKFVVSDEWIPVVMGNRIARAARLARDASPWERIPEPPIPAGDYGAEL